MADLANAIGGIEKLNNYNYDYWRLCVEAYLQGQDLWEIVGGTDTTAPANDNAEALRKWRIKAGKVMFVLRITVQKELLEHIRDADIPKNAWDMLATLFSKTNDVRLQFLENELASITQESMDNREFPMICLEKMDPNLYKAAMEGNMDFYKNVMEYKAVMEGNMDLYMAAMEGNMDLYMAAMEGNMELLTSNVEANDHWAPNLTRCLTLQKNTALHIAVEFGHKNIVEKVIQLCPSLVSQPNSKGDTPLHLAARAGHHDLTKLLTPALNSNLTVGNRELEGGNHVRRYGSMALRMGNLEGNNPIHEALKKSHRKVALHLLAFEEGHHELARDVNKAGESLLYLAAEAGLDEVVQKIIDSGDYSTSGPDGQNPLHMAVIKGQLEVVKILLLDKESNFIPQEDHFGNTGLHYASAESYCRVCKDEDGYWTRLWSKNQSQKKILELLLEANPSLAYVPNRNGDYPLFIAIRNDFGLAVCTILNQCPESAELVNRKGQNALHLTVMQKATDTFCKLIKRREFKKLINEPDNDGNTPMHLATLTNQLDIVKGLISGGPPDLTMSNKEGLTALDVSGYPEREHPICHLLREYGAVPGRHRWQERFSRIERVKISPEFKKYGLQTLPIVTSLVVTVTFAAAFTVPGGYKNDGPREGFPVFMGDTTLQAFVLSDMLAFCSSMAATILLVYANAHSEDAFKIHYTLNTCYYISGVAILATIIAFVTAMCVLTSKESPGLAVTSFLLGSAVPLFIVCYRQFLKKGEWNLDVDVHAVEFLFAHRRDNV